MSPPPPPPLGGDKAEQVEAEEGEHEQSDVFHPFEPLD